jgi:hypothetical protein
MPVDVSNQNQIHHSLILPATLPGQRSFESKENRRTRSCLT